VCSAASEPNRGRCSPSPMTRPGSMMRAPLRSNRRCPSTKETSTRRRCPGSSPTPRPIAGAARCWKGARPSRRDARGAVRAASTTGTSCSASMTRRGWGRCASPPSRRTPSSTTSRSRCRRAPACASSSTGPGSSRSGCRVRAGRRSDGSRCWSRRAARWAAPGRRRTFSTTPATPGSRSSPRARIGTTWAPGSTSRPGSVRRPALPCPRCGCCGWGRRRPPSAQGGSTARTAAGVSTPPR
jgi:hypothetical protein